jgi:hypothetical protein
MTYKPTFIQHPLELSNCFANKIDFVAPNVSQIPRKLGQYMLGLSNPDSHTMPSSKRAFDLSDQIIEKSPTKF